MLPPKIKIWTWRAIHNRLPTKDNLIKRGIAIDSICAFYGVLYESLGYILFNCKHSLSLWRAIFLYSIALNHCMGTGDVWIHLWCQMDRTDFLFVSLFGWVLWYIEIWLFSNINTVAISVIGDAVWGSWVFVWILAHPIHLWSFPLFLFRMLCWWLRDTIRVLLYVWEHWF